MMEKHVKCYLIFLFILFIGFKVEAKYKMPDHVKAAREVRSTFARAAEKEFGVYCIGGGGSMPHDVEMIEVDFLSYEVGSVEKAREFIVKATEKFLKVINDDTNIRPFLREYSFKANRAEIILTFMQKGYEPIRRDGSIVVAFQLKNRIFYYIENAEGKRIKVKDELYDNALKIVLGNSEKKVS